MECANGLKVPRILLFKKQSDKTNTKFLLVEKGPCYRGRMKR